MNYKEADCLWFGKNDYIIVTVVIDVYMRG